MGGDEILGEVGNKEWYMTRWRSNINMLNGENALGISS
jgi:hypothetical protein